MQNWQDSVVLHNKPLHKRLAGGLQGRLQNDFRQVWVPMNPEMVLAMSAILRPVEPDKLVGAQRGD
ncbi:MAG: hypothetical protein PHP23_10575 [Desulfobacterales bacterium]|nr:hypothetical protein [Desulfobacterales bacterium]MDD4073056.1 hypothetical protein [Desulfobacterales bacterium]MDD4393461.1 hypothetical protein [Desulfobacterales bacterium]